MRGRMWPSDEDLMLSYGDGDEDAFDTLYRRYEKPLLDSIFPWYGYNDKSVDISIRPR